MKSPRLSGVFLLGCLLFPGAFVPANAVISDPPAPSEPAPLFVPQPIDDATQLAPDSLWVLLLQAHFRVDQPLPPFAAPFEEASVDEDTAPYFILKFAGPVQAAWKKHVGALGVTLYDYLPVNAFLARIPGDKLAGVRALPEVKWIGPWLTPFRVTQGLVERLEWELRQTPSATVNLSWRLAPDEPLKEKAASIALALGAVSYATEPWPSGNLMTTAVEVPDGGVAALFPRVLQAASVPGVFWVETAPRYRPLNRDAAWVTQTFEQNNTPIWEHGIYGAGQIVSCADTGMDPDHCAFNDPTQPLPGPMRNNNHRKIIAYFDLAGNGDWDTNGHGTHVSGSICGDEFSSPGQPNGYDGMAPAAKIVFQDVGNGADLVGVPGNLNNLFQPMFNFGARIHSDSWGSSFNTYSSNARQVDEFTFNNQHFSVFFANGNDGPDLGTVGEPATAKNAISVGATNNGLSGSTMTSFSSRGPTQDGRRKPTVVDPGIINSALSDRNPTTNNCGYTTFGGTSMATPISAGCGALVREYFTAGWFPLGEPDVNSAFEPSGALLKAVMVNGAAWVNGNSPAPDDAQGWGRVLLDNALYFAGDSLKLDVQDINVGLATGETRTFQYQVISNTLPLKITLVWTDPPANSASGINLVNDLDLSAQGPNADHYQANDLQMGISLPGSSTPDRRNVVEEIYIPNPATGTWNIEVRAENVPVDTQPFALVVTGDMGFARGSVQVDRATYNCDTNMVVTVNDTGLNGTGTVEVLVKSDTEPSGESLTLQESGTTPGIFMGAVHLSSGSAASDGVLQVSGDDLIHVEYIDADDGTGGMNILRTAAARVDCTAPVISNVQVKVLTAYSAEVSWDTDEDSYGTVRWGDSAPLLSSVYDPVLSRHHHLTLTGRPCSTILIAVEAVDAVGNLSTDDNGGEYYRVILPQEIIDWMDNVEADSNWTATGDWALSAQRVYSGTYSWASGHRNNASTTLTSPAFALPTGLPSVFRFHSAWDYEEGWDGGFIELTSDDGTTWERITPVGGYPTVSNSDTRSCVGRDQGCFTGTNLVLWDEFLIDLAPWIGQTVRIRFHNCTDRSEGGENWYLDQFRLGRFQVCAATLSFGDIQLDDTTHPCTDSDYLPDAGETLNVSVSVDNWSGSDSQVSLVELTASLGEITIEPPTRQVPVLAATNGSATLDFEVTVPGSGVPCGGDVTFTATLHHESQRLTKPLTVPYNADVRYNGSFWTDKVAPGPDSWTAEGLWGKVADRFYSGGVSWFSGAASSLCARLISPSMAIAREGRSELNFWTLYSLEEQYDGGIVEVSANDGQTWTKIAPIGGYPGQIGSRSLSCIGTGAQCFIGISGWRFVRFDLSSFKEKTVRIAFRVGNNTRNEWEGWYVDDITVVGAVETSRICDDTPCGPGDETPPQMTQVDIWTTLSTRKGYFQGSWAGTDNSGPVAQYWAAIGTSPGSDDGFSWTNLDTNTSLILTDPILRSDPVYYLTIMARDASGLFSAPMSSEGVHIEWLGPSATISSPANNDHLTGSTIAITGTADDGPTGSGVASAEVSKDAGSTWTTATGDLNWSYTWSPVVDGTYTLMARGVDRLGNLTDPPEKVTVILRNFFNPTPTPSETPGGPTPTPTVTPTETPGGTAPWLMAAGYMATNLTVDGGRLHFLAYVSDDEGDDSRVEITYQGQGLGAYLNDDGTGGDSLAGDHLYEWVIEEIGPGPAPARLALGLIAADQTGRTSPEWPYLVVE